MDDETLAAPRRSWIARGAVAAGVLAVAVMFWLGRDRTPLPPMALVPADAVSVIELRWNDVAADPVLKHFAYLPSSADALRAATGIVVADAGSVLIFSDAVPPFTGDGTLILSSIPTVRRFIDVAERGRWTERRARGFTIYDEPRGPHAGLMVSDDVMAWGARESLARVVDVAGREAPSFLARSELADLQAMFVTPNPVRVAIALPAGGARAADGLGGLLKLFGIGVVAAVIEQAGLGRAAALTCGRVPAGVRCTAAGVMKDAMTAALLSGGLTLLARASTVVPEDYRKVAPLAVSDFTVEATGATVTVGMSVR